MKYLFVTFFIAVLSTGFFLFFSPNVVMVVPPGGAQEVVSTSTIALPDPVEATSSPTGTVAIITSTNGDIERQSQLANPPDVVRALYVTGWSAGLPDRMKKIKELIKKKGLNGIVIDIKDYSGFVSYRTGVAEIESTGAEKNIRIAHPNALIKELHDAGIYVIGRVTVFQDPILAKAHPEWALKDKTTGGLWLDNHKLAWMDASAEPVWNYVIAIGKDALDRGFDEVNYDYIRFPSDGKLSQIQYPFWNGQGTKHEQIAKFFAYVREKFTDAKISADIFGLATSASDDLGIGQKIEDAYTYFDYVAPMIYPSHFASGFNGYKNPADHPYEVIHSSLTSALYKYAPVVKKASMASSTASSTPATSTSPAKPYIAKLRPWLQVFDLGAKYDKAKIDAQIKATEDVLNNGSSTDHFGGWLLWDPSNIYKNL